MTNRGDNLARLQALPIYWYNKASDLRAAACAVWVAMKDDPPDNLLGFTHDSSVSAACPMVYWMLCGQALELCLKAAIVAQGKQPTPIHELVKLSVEAGIAYDPRSLQLLRVLSDAVAFYARHPFPTGDGTKSRAECDSVLTDIEAALFDEQPLGKFKVLQPDFALDWNGFSQLWELAHAEYWRNHHRT